MAGSFKLLQFTKIFAISFFVWIYHHNYDGTPNSSFDRTQKLDQSLYLRTSRLLSTCNPDSESNGEIPDVKTKNFYKKNKQNKLGILKRFDSYCENKIFDRLNAIYNTEDNISIKHKAKKTSVCRDIFVLLALPIIINVSCVAISTQKDKLVSGIEYGAVVPVVISLFILIYVLIKTLKFLIIQEKKDGHSLSDYLSAFKKLF
ncbi:tryptophan-rich antigen [Plasmodium gonderi]|uniref:Tryptophan-rich antigen n=1 Tax=Plasmodium gonderi TaxID=77519 RepID=A0A1Y1JA63_PLAGO|nr:tryptophan-rich antigen [Plasmodium gonderi]GAW79399.1 tryptophan-rich antigen [Plasmodium gonderi]